MIPTVIDPAVSLQPQAPATLEETGLSPDLITQLLLKMLHFAGELSGIELARRAGLPFPVIEALLDALKRQRHCEVAGGLAVGGASYRYRITDAGRVRAVLLLEQNQYVGTAPVPLGQYRRYMDAFKKAVPLEAGDNIVHFQFGSPLFAFLTAVVSINAAGWLVAAAWMAMDVVRSRTGA